MSKTIKLLFLVIFILQGSILKAQSYGNYDKKPFTLGLFPPLSTNGGNEGNCVNQFAVNLFMGYSAGLAGTEFAGFSNTERDFVRGAQFAGFGNFVNGEFVGFQFAGFGNFNRGVSNGFQFAGFSNFNYAQADGVLAAGFFNFTNGKSLAMQFAGFANFCEDVEGIQAAGFANVVKGNGKVVQLSGFANLTQGEVNGIQAAGFLNYSAKKMENFQAAGFANLSGGDANGAQLGGFMNIAKGNVTGTQIAGFMNVATKDVTGFQLAGFLNAARKVTGTQIGFINIADSISHGVPIGFLSIVRKGFHEIEISTGEALNASASFKIGVSQFYNIFSIGYQALHSGKNWGVGYGIGTHLVNNPTFKTQLELMAYHINEGKAWTDVSNELNQVKLTFTKKMNDHFGIYAGPTLNLLVTDNKPDNGSYFDSHFAPYTMVSHSGHHTTLEGWIGFTAGIRIN